MLTYHSPIGKTNEEVIILKEVGKDYYLVRTKDKDSEGTIIRKDYLK